MQALTHNCHTQNIVSRINSRKRLKCLRQHLVPTSGSSSMWKPLNNHLFQTCVALKGYHMEMTNSSIWISPLAMLGPLQGPFPACMTSMSHFPGMPYTVVEIMTLTGLLVYTTYVRPRWLPMQGNTVPGVDQSMEKNKREGHILHICFHPPYCWRETSARAPRQLWNTENKHYT